jgi:hypothetical protein
MVGVPGQHEVHLGTAVGDEDLLAVHPDAAVLKLGSAGGDAPQVAPGLGLGEVHAALDLAAGEAR